MTHPTGRFHELLILGAIVGFLTDTTARADDESPALPSVEAENSPGVDLFDALDQGLVDAKFVARDSARGRLVLTNKTKEPLDILVPEAFAGVPVMRQFGGGGGGRGGGGGGMGGGGGGQQNVGGGGGGGRGGGFGGGGGGAFNIPPEDITRIDVPLLCLDHGLKDPSSSKPYEVRPIEDVVDNPAVIEIVKAYANGELPRSASQAATWHLNSRVNWIELASKLTGTKRNFVREPYFSRGELRTAMLIVNQAEAITAGQVVKRRNWRIRGRSEPVAAESADEQDYDSSKSEVDSELAETVGIETDGEEKEEASSVK